MTSRTWKPTAWAFPQIVPPTARWLPAVLLIGLLALTQALIATARHSTLPITPEDRAEVLLDGVYAAEQDARGSFRWIAGAGRLRIPPAVGAQTAALELRLGPTLPELIGTPATISWSGRALATLQLGPAPRRLLVLLPARGGLGDEWVGLESGRVAVADGRAVGLRFEGALLRALDRGLRWPALGLMLAQALLLGLIGLTLRRAGVAGQAAWATLVLAGLALAGGYSLQPLLMPLYVTRLVAATALLALLTFTLLPLIERRLAWLARPALLRAVWVVTLLAWALRLIGALYPAFGAYDLQLNIGRLVGTLTGTLVFTNRAFEFRSGVTVYPPGPYLVILPGLLAGLTPKLLIQGFMALVDGSAALTTALLAGMLGASRRTILFSALLYAAVPVGLTALWYGLTAQVFGQALMAPLALALLVALRKGGRPAWLTAGMLLSVAYLSHIGVTILAVAWLALAWLALLLRRAVPRPALWRLGWVLLVSGAIGLLFAYAPVAVLKLQQTRAVGERVLEGGYVPAYNLIWRGFLIAFHRLAFALLPAGLLLVRRARLGSGGAEVAGNWLVAVAVFWTVEMVSGLQVRYILFLAPLACIVAAHPLAQLAERGRAGRIVAWGTLLLLLAQGAALWYVGTFQNVAMSMVSLLR